MLLSTFSLENRVFSGIAIKVSASNTSGCGSNLVAVSNANELHVSLRPPLHNLLEHVINHLVEPFRKHVICEHGYSTVHCRANPLLPKFLTPL